MQFSEFCSGGPDGPGHCSVRALAFELAMEVKKSGMCFLSSLPVEVHCKDSVKALPGWKTAFEETAEERIDFGNQRKFLPDEQRLES